MTRPALARYAAVCQAHGIVPIVEPDVVMAGDHDLDKNGQVCRKVSHSVPKTFKTSFYDRNDNIQSFYDYISLTQIIFYTSGLVILVQGSERLQCLLAGSGTEDQHGDFRLVMP